MFGVTLVLWLGLLFFAIFVSLGISFQLSVPPRQLSVSLKLLSVSPPPPNGYLRPQRDCAFNETLRVKVGVRVNDIKGARRRSYLAAVRVNNVAFRVFPGALSASRAFRTTAGESRKRVSDKEMGQ